MMGEVLQSNSSQTANRTVYSPSINEAMSEMSSRQVLKSHTDEFAAVLGSTSDFSNTDSAL